jgi:hypothetical protein
VLFIDDAHLTSKPAPIPKQLNTPLIGGETRSYDVTLLFEGINGTIVNGTWILGDSTISDANVTYTESGFGTVLNGTSQTASFTFTVFTVSIWASIALALGIAGFCLVTIGPIVMMKMLKQKKLERLVLLLICVITGVSLILTWILTL